MRKPIEQRIRELEEQKRALQSRLEKQERAQTTRRKILLGAFVLERLERNDKTSDASALRHLLQLEFLPSLARDIDRQLFADLLPASGGRTVESGTVGGGATIPHDDNVRSPLETDDATRTPSEADGVDGVADVDASSTGQSITGQRGGWR